MLWILFVLAIVDGQPVVKFAPVKDQATCEALKAEITETLIANNIQEASVTCFDATPKRTV